MCLVPKSVSKDDFKWLLQTLLFHQSIPSPAVAITTYARTDV